MTASEQNKTERKTNAGPTPVSPEPDSSATKQEGAVFPWPIAVMSFQRPHLLKEVLQCLKQQTEGLDDANVFLFQDGAVDGFGGANLGEQRLVDECVDIFRDMFPNGKVHLTGVNLGVAINFDRAERLFFEDMAVEAAVFLEDDLALSPHYLGIIRTLLNFALETPKVAYVAAYGNHRSGLEEQRRHSTNIVGMHHKWGFGLTRRQWELQRPILDPYLDIVRRKSYINRDHAAVYEYFASLGYVMKQSSQDAAKDVASAVLGTAKIMTYACFGKYIGREGLHFREEDYVREGYGDTVLFPDAVPAFKLPSDLELTRLAEAQRPPQQQKPPAAPAMPQDANFPVHMTKAEIELLTPHLRRSRYYLEFGTGGSTVLAANECKGTLVCVDSDAAWISKLKEVDEIKKGVAANRITFYHADLGPIGPWGVPKDESRIKAWKNYYVAPWVIRDFDYDLILIDGRFRVMCALSAAINADRSSIIAIHDYGNRRPYYAVEKYFDVISTVDKLVILQKRARINYKALFKDFSDFIYDVS